MNMINTLNCKFSDEIDKEVRKNSEYITSGKQLYRFVRKKFSKEKAECLDDLLSILIGIAGDAYIEEGIRLGARLMVSSVFEEDDDL